tara:strand:- start:317 stop:871 length:555 start_codon:yes stop_codon:yes gene_type:complete
MFNIFSSFLHEDFFSLDIRKIKKEILNIKSKDKGRIVSNYGGWQSQSLTTINKNFQSLFDNINMSVKKIEKHLNLEKKLSLHNYWCNMNYFGSFNSPHEHPNSVLSGVYYVLTPINSGSIVFLNDNLDLYYKNNAKKYNEYNSSTWRSIPEENKCILFPSYLTHYVEPNLNKKERVSISFNYGF